MGLSEVCHHSYTKVVSIAPPAQEWQELEEFRLAREAAAAEAGAEGGAGEEPLPEDLPGHAPAAAPAKPIGPVGPALPPAKVGTGGVG
jgi:hypothetical protein